MSSIHYPLKAQRREKTNPTSSPNDLKVPATYVTSDDFHVDEKKEAKVKSKRANLTFNPSAESPQSTNISLHTPSFSKEIEPSSVHQITTPIERKLSFTSLMSES